MAVPNPDLSGSRIGDAMISEVSALGRLQCVPLRPQIMSHSMLVLLRCLEPLRPTNILLVSFGLSLVLQFSH